MSLRGSFSCQKRSPHLSDLNCSPRIHWKVAPSKPPLGSALSSSPEEDDVDEKFTTHARIATRQFKGPFLSLYRLGLAEKTAATSADVICH